MSRSKSTSEKPARRRHTTATELALSPPPAPTTTTTVEPVTTADPAPAPVTRKRQDKAAPFTPPPRPPVFRLVNAAGWAFAYAPQGESVTVTRSYRGAPVGALVYAIVAARLHYANLRRQGFYKLEGS